MQSFTFQSGSIQINTSNDNKLNVNGFTFQSGSIQMGITENYTEFMRDLYIPIWFYSNIVLALLFFVL